VATACICLKGQASISLQLPRSRNASAGKARTRSHPASHQPSCFDFRYDGPGFGKGAARGVLKVGRQGRVATQQKSRTPFPFIIAVEENLRRGCRYPHRALKTRTIRWPFRFTGKLDKLTIRLGPVQLTRRGSSGHSARPAPGREQLMPQQFRAGCPFLGGPGRRPWPMSRWWSLRRPSGPARQGLAGICKSQQHLPITHRSSETA